MTKIAELHSDDTGSLVDNGWQECACCEDEEEEDSFGIKECDDFIEECDKIIEMCEAARRMADEERLAMREREAETMTESRPIVRVHNGARTERQIEELEAVYDAITFRRNGTRCEHRMQIQRHETPRGRKHARRGRSSKTQPGQRREQLSVAREHAEYLTELMQPCEDLMQGADAIASDEYMYDQVYDRYAFLRQCDEIIRLCKLTREMGDEELEVIAVLAETRHQKEQEELAKDQQQLLEQREAKRWAWEPEITADPHPGRGGEAEDEWRAEKHEWRLGVATTPFAQQQRKCGARKQTTARHRRTRNRISARELKREQALEAQRAAKRSVDAAADVERQATWRARLAASTASAQTRAKPRYYYHGQSGGDGARLRSAPRTALLAADASTTCRLRSTSYLDTDDATVDGEHEVAIDAAALGVDAATARLLRELQYREVNPEDYELLGRLDETIDKPPSKLCTVSQVGRFALITFATKLGLAESAESAECGVCLCPLEQGDQARRLPCCVHALFHDECITQWLTEQSEFPLTRHVSCCRHVSC